MKAEGKGRGLAYSSNCIFLDTQLSSNGDLGLERGGARCKKRKQVESDSKGPMSKNIDINHEKEVSETDMLADGKSCVFLEPELKNKGELGLERCNAMYGGGNEDDPQYMIFLASTIQQGTSYITTLEENGSPLVLHYEKENVCRDEPDYYVCRRRVKNIKKGHDDDDDPQYLTFLANTVQKGTSYVTKLEENNNGLPLFIHYEKEDGSGEECDDVSRRRVKNIKKEYNDNGWGNGDDPQYEIFLASTIQKGASYMTKLEENGLPLFLHYEKEDGSGDEPVDVGRRRVKNIEKGHNAREKAFGTVSGEYKVERANDINMVLEKNKDVSVVVDNEMIEPPYTVSAGHRLVPKSHYDYDIDSGSHKERSTENRRNNGSNNGRSSQNWRISGKDREEENIEDCYITCENYAVKTSFSGNWHMECGYNHSEGVEAIPNNYAVVCKERSPDLSPGNQLVEYDLKDWEEEKIDDDYYLVLQTCENNASKASCESNQLVEYDLEDWEKENIDYDYLVFQQKMTYENYASKPSSQSNQLVEYDLKDWKKENIDYDYLVFQQNMTYENYGIKVSFQSNKLVEYGCNHSQDVKVIQNNNYAMVCKERSPDLSPGNQHNVEYDLKDWEERSPGLFISSKEYLSLDESCKLGGETMQSPFRKKIINILKRPYNQSEYEKLLKDVKVQKPILKHMELRNGRDMLYRTSKPGKSYLDHHKDLKKRLKAERTDKHKRLNILRGFFFWLQNVTVVGVFKPWNDPTCLAILPAGSC